MSPTALGATTATMIATDLADDGRLQTPVTGKVLGVPGESAGPPEGPLGVRVSRMRQGAIVKKPLAAGGRGVAVGVSAGVGVGVVVRVPVGVGVAVGMGVGPEDANFAR